VGDWWGWEECCCLDTRSRASKPFPNHQWFFDRVGNWMKGFEGDTKYE